MSQQMQYFIANRTSEWYTPVKFIEDVRRLLGEIELDPASSDLPQTWIRAARYYTEEMNGLSLDWQSKTLFLNPPYGKTCGKSNQAVWSKKLIAEYEKGNVQEAVLIVHTNQGYKWYEQIYLNYPVCLAFERFRFLNEQGQEGSGRAKKGQTIVYFGKNIEKFIEVFKSYGRILLPEGT